jgi:DNA-directed RNA polymerase specialized sigma24 family protein
MSTIASAEELAEASPGPSVSLETREESERVRAVLSRMDAHTQALLWLCAAERMPVEEASRVLRRPPSTLRYQLSKALDRARRELSPAGSMVPVPEERTHELR